MKVVIVGSGKSLDNLSEKDIKIINSADRVLVFNKMCGHYSDYRLRATDLYFHDFFHWDLFREYIGRVDLEHKTLYTNNVFARYFYRSNLVAAIFNDVFVRFYHLVLMLILLVTGKDGNLSRFILFREWSYIKLPSTSVLHGVRLGRDGERIIARTYKDDFFHCMGSLSTCINLGLILPGCTKIHLVGVDFNKDGYASKIIDRHDHTKLLVKASRVSHYSLTQESKFKEGLTWLKENAKDYNTEIVVSSKDSWLVEKDIFYYEALA